MEPNLHKGQLKAWKDDRGFGFIKPDNGGKDVFLHISALKRASRRPQVGDTILYEQVAESNGKIRAAKASIQGIVAQTRPAKRKGQKSNRWFEIAGSAVLASVVALLSGQFGNSRSPFPARQFGNSRSPSPVTAVTQPECKIKGNISVSTGKKVYHLPGMEDYNSTVIDRARGERWFCKESEARAQGWSKAPR